jgi:acetyl esterase/lipase
MSLIIDPEIAAALAPMAQSGFAPPAVGDIAGRRAMWEPIIGAASTAQPIPADVVTSEYYATADDGAQIKLRWYVKHGATPGPAVLFFHGGGYIFGHIDLFDARCRATCWPAVCRCCWSSTAARPSTRSRRPSRMPTLHCVG